MGGAEADTYPAQITFPQSNYAQKFLEAREEGHHRPRRLARRVGLAQRPVRRRCHRRRRHRLRGRAEGAREGRVTVVTVAAGEGRGEAGVEAEAELGAPRPLHRRPESVRRRLHQRLRYRRTRRAALE